MKRLKKLPKGLSVLDDNGHNLLIGRLYQTDIVHYQQATLTLRHGGWLTNHTKKCTICRRYVNLNLDLKF